MTNDIQLMQEFDPATHFVTPDRKLEQYLFRQGFSFSEFIKGETGWTYWVYRRTSALMDAISQFTEYRSRKRYMLQQLSDELG